MEKTKNPKFNCDASKYGLKLKQVDYYWIVREAWKSNQHLDAREPSVRSTRKDVLLPSNRGLHFPKEHIIQDNPYHHLLDNYGDSKHNFIRWSAIEKLEVEHSFSQITLHLVYLPTEVFHGITWKLIHLDKLVLQFAEATEIREFIECCVKAKIIKILPPVDHKSHSSNDSLATTKFVFKIRKWIRQDNTNKTIYNPGQAVCILSENKQQSLIAQAKAKGESIHDFQKLDNKPKFERPGVKVKSYPIEVFRV